MDEFPSAVLKLPEGALFLLEWEFGHRVKRALYRKESDTQVQCIYDGAGRRQNRPYGVLTRWADNLRCILLSPEQARQWKAFSVLAPDEIDPKLYFWEERQADEQA